MSSLDADDCPLPSSQIQYWTPKAVLGDYEDGSWATKYPLNPSADAQTFEFRSPGEGERCIDLGQSFFELEVEILKADGTDMGADEEVALSNNSANSMFQQAVVSLNNVDVTSSVNTYHMKAYLETLLSFSPDSANQLAMGGFVKDTAQHIDTAGDANVSFTKRKAWTNNGKKAALFGKLRVSLADANELLPTGIDFTLKLTKCKDTLILQQPAANATVYKTAIPKIALHLRKVKLSPQAILNQAKQFETMGPAKIHLKDGEVKMYAVPKGMRSHKIENLCIGQLPNEMYIGLVANDAVNGHKTKRFYNFQPFNVNFLQLTRDGAQHPSPAFKPDYSEKGNHLAGYHSLYVANGKINSDEALLFNRDEYAKGYTLYGFNFTPDLGETNVSPQRKKGEMTLDIGFARELAEPINIIVYSTFEHSISIDKNRNVFLDFTP